MSSAVDGETPDDLAPSLSADALAAFRTHGDPIRSWARLATTIVDEARLHVDEDGLTITAVDPANVALIDLHAPASGFEDYEVDGEHVVGLNLDRFTDAINWARKRGGDGDPVAVELLDDPVRLRVTVTREDQSVRRVSEWFTLDPAKIREEPETPDITLPNYATPSVRALRDAVTAVDAHHDRVYVSRDETDLLLATTPDGDTTPTDSDDNEFSTDVQDAVRFLNTAWDTRDEDAQEADSSLFSLDYLTDIAQSLKTAKADRVTIKWADEFPTRLAFEYEDWGFSGHFMLAPRIQSEEDR